MKSEIDFHVNGSQIRACFTCERASNLDLFDMQMKMKSELVLHANESEVWTCFTREWEWNLKSFTRECKRNPNLFDMWMKIKSESDLQMNDNKFWTCFTCDLFWAWIRTCLTCEWKWNLKLWPRTVKKKNSQANLFSRKINFLIWTHQSTGNMVFRSIAVLRIKIGALFFLLKMWLN